MCAGSGCTLAVTRRERNFFLRGEKEHVTANRLLWKFEDKSTVDENLEWPDYDCTKENKVGP